MSAVAHIKDFKAGKFFRDDFRGTISWNGYEHNVLLRNEGTDQNGRPRFADIAMATGADDDKDARGMSTADFDNDGDLDLVINNNPGDNGKVERARAVLLQNNVGQRREWVTVELEGTQSNRDAVGATVTIESAGQKQLRLMTAGSGFSSQHSARLYFGLNDQTQIQSLTVQWPRGQVQRFEQIDGQPIKSKQLIKIKEGGAIEARGLPQK